MMEYVKMSLEDGDIVLFVVDPFDEVSEEIQKQVQESPGIPAGARSPPVRDNPCLSVSTETRVSDEPAPQGGSG